MNLTSKDLLQLTNITIDAAIAAGKYIATRIGEQLTVENKSGKSIVDNTLASQVVTEVDFASQKIILEKLSKAAEDYDLGLLTEELEDDKSRFSKDFFWCIDPLDGTLPFIENRSGYAVVIALVAKSGEAQIGVIYDPKSGDLYHATKNKGAYKNGVRLDVTTQARGEKLFFITDRSFTNHQDYNKCVQQLKSYAAEYGMTEVQELSVGGAALHACWMLDQMPACYFKFPKEEQGGGSIWDYAASSVIAKEAGAVATDIYGLELKLNNRETTFMNKGGILYATDELLSNFVTEFYKRLKSELGN